MSHESTKVSKVIHGEPLQLLWDTVLGKSVEKVNSIVIKCVKKLVSRQVQITEAMT